MIQRGGTNEARLYLEDIPDLGIVRTDMPDMPNLIARHKARYLLAGFFCRPGMNVLDFPCGSGYGSEVFNGAEYSGMDIDGPTIEYCKRMYGGWVTFSVGDLTKPTLMPSSYDLIACIEGFEHIGQEYQEPLIRAFYEALCPGGILIVSSPEAPWGSGPSKKNPYHKWELSQYDFADILYGSFSDVQILRHKDTLHNGEPTTCLYGICRKEN